MKKGIVMLCCAMLFAVVLQTNARDIPSAAKKDEGGKILSVSEGVSLFNFSKKVFNQYDKPYGKFPLNTKLACRLEEIKCITNAFTSECPTPKPPEKDLVYVGLTASLIKDCVLSSKPECKDLLPIVCTSPENSKFNTFVQPCVPEITWNAKCSDDKSMLIKAECIVKDNVEFVLGEVPSAYYFCLKPTCPAGDASCPAGGVPGGKIDTAGLKLDGEIEDGVYVKGNITSHIIPNIGPACCIGEKDDPCKYHFSGETKYYLGTGPYNALIGATIGYNVMHINGECKLLVNFDSLLD